MKSIHKRCLTLQYLLVFLLLLGGQALFAQPQPPVDSFWNEALERIAKPNSKPGWIYFKDSLFINARTVFQDFKVAFRLSENDSMALKKTKEDNLGFQHYYFDQYYKNVRVNSAKMIVHAKPELIGEFTTPVAKIANGKMVIGLNLITIPTVSEQEALNQVFQVFNAENGEWNQDTSLFPRGELVIHRISLDRDLVAGNMTLAWKFDLRASYESITYFVDAQTGAILNSLLIAKDCDPGTVATTWNGNQTISIDQNGTMPDNFILLDDCGDHNWELRTLDGNGATNFTAVATEYNSGDAAYNANAVEMVGGTTQWAFHESLDYFATTFARDSYDDGGGNVTAYSNVIYNTGNPMNPTTGNNAMSHGSGVFSFGRGNNAMLATDDWNTIDVVGHEFAHGVTDNEANLDYNRESGALNESFSDIFGEAVQRFATGANDWLVGADRNGTGIRNMSNPNAFGDPDSYTGTNWVNTVGCMPTGNNDQCGVHTNSGVQNFWFFLLANGGTGTNDFGETFDVTGIGFDKAAAIAYRNLNVYLTNTSNYLDAREGALNAAADLFGNCSNEQIQVGRAWYAVHVGNDHPDFNNQICGVINAGDFRGINSLLGGGICINDVNPSAGNITFAAAREVRLLPGCTITASAGRTFTAFIDPCAITVRDAFVAPKRSKQGDHFSDVKKEDSIHVNSSDIQLEIRPNPTYGQTTLVYHLEEPTLLSIQLQDQTGRTIRTIQPVQAVQAGDYTLEVEMNDLPAGLFFISVITDKTILTKKMALLK